MFPCRLLAFRFRLLRRGAARTVAIFLAAEGIRRAIVAADAFDAERLLERLSVHSHRHGVVAGVRDDAAAAEATTATAATAADRGLIHADDRPDLFDRVQRRGALAATTATSTAPCRRSRRRCERRGRRRVETGKTTATTTAAAATGRFTRTARTVPTASSGDNSLDRHRHHDRRRHRHVRRHLEPRRWDS